VCPVGLSTVPASGGQPAAAVPGPPRPCTARPARGRQRQWQWQWRIGRAGPAGPSKRVTVTAASGGLFSTAILKLEPGGLGVAISYQLGV
jgi:hypothetical protein